MTEDDKINIKLEVYKDKTSGKLAIKAHFNSNAPNIFKDKASYSWIPTAEEKDLINEAFQLIPADAGYTPTRETVPKPEEIEEEKSIPEPVIDEELQPTPETQPTEDEIKPADLSPLEKSDDSDDSDDFEVTDKDIKGDDLDKEIDKNIEETPPKVEEPTVEEQTAEETKPDESETKKKEKDEGIIVEANSEAIEAALKKHIEKDKSIVEADEKTIIDKVLNQKKKGKWSRR